MHAILLLLLYWALAFVSLGIAVVLVNVYSSVIDGDATLHSMGREAAIAGVASLIEAASVWVVLSFIPGATRALILPAMVVALIYKVTHFEDWSAYDVLLLLAFQLVIGLSGAALFSGQFGLAVLLIGCFGIGLAIVASIIRSL